MPRKKSLHFTSTGAFCDAKRGLLVKYLSIAMNEAQSKSAPYIFGRDHKSSIRLNYQHMLIKKLCNEQLLHETVQRGISSLSSIRIADIATGTAIWLTELSDALPADCQLHGFDISADQYPPKEWLPENVFLHEHDAFTPFPPEFLGSFDVVNLRSFITLLNRDNVQILLRNLKSLLKPGGFLHWLDFDPRSTKAISIRPGIQMPRTENVVSMMRQAQPDPDLWILHDSALLEAAGLKPIAYERIQLRNHLRPLWNECLIMGIEELSRRMCGSSGGDGDKLSPLLHQVTDLAVEFSQGTSIDAQWFVMVGQMSSRQ